MLVKKVDNDWYIGRLGDQQGMFPVKFVEIIEDLPQEVKQETQVILSIKASVVHRDSTRSILKLVQNI